VRNAEGRWNLENLLERAAKTPVAPTSKTRSEVRPGFPYIEADHGRINFKSGPEKKPYSLTEANFALWQDSENAWGVRLKAQPMRTDFNLSDTGLLEVEGSWERAVNLHQTPLQFAVQWEGAQLGQVTKLTLGQDKGWRGAIEITAALTGTPEDLTEATDATVQDFHRYDIASDKSLRLAAHCGGHYSSTDHVVSKIACRGPVGDGVIAVDGTVALLSALPAYNLTVLAQKVPVQPLVDLARRMKKNIPSGIVATGKLDEDDHRRMRDPVERQAAQVLSRVERKRPEPPPAAEVHRGDRRRAAWVALPAGGAALACVLVLLSGALAPRGTGQTITGGAASVSSAQGPDPTSGPDTTAQPPSAAQLAAVETALARVRTGPKDVGAHLDLARAYAGAGAAQLSAIEYLAVTQLDPGNAGANTQLALIAFAAGQAAQAKKLVDTALTAHPLYPEALYARGLIQLMGLRDPTAAQRDLRAYLAAAPRGSHRASVETLLAIMSGPAR
jgi:hypothetical protein